MSNIEISYASAGVIPAKVIIHEKLIERIKKDGRIMPIHLQLNPTNKCNLSCSFCSCANRDRKLELSLEDIVEIMKKAKECGCESVTITGGGEPLMHCRINEVIDGIHSIGIEIGLVTNGLLLGRLSTDSLSKIVWCRISSSDDRPIDAGYENTLEDAIHRGKNVDWAFSHVVTRNPSYLVMARIIDFANKHNFTHVRLVSDLLDLDKVPSLSEIKDGLREIGVDDRIVNYQDRQLYTSGMENCYISLLKPVIGADGYIYPCCGTQYALENPSRDYEKTMRMCLATDIDRLYKEQLLFNGSVCSKCYYDNYNTILKILLSDIRHKNFV